MNKLPTSTAQPRLDRLERKLRKLQVFSAVTVLSLVTALCVIIAGRVYADTPAKAARNASFDAITVKRINVVENDGTRRMVISGATNAPPPILNGKAYKRAVMPAGITFYNSKGDERGGIGLASRNGGEQSVLVFDYTKSEAMALIRSQNDKMSRAGLLIVDPAPADAPPGQNGNLRVEIQTVNGNAQIVLNDADGKPRLRMVVPKQGEPAIELLDAAGKVTRKISSNVQ